MSILQYILATWIIQSKTVQESPQDWHGGKKDPHSIHLLHPLSCIRCAGLLLGYSQCKKIHQ